MLRNIVGTDNFWAGVRWYVIIIFIIFINDIYFAYFPFESYYLISSLRAASLLHDLIFQPENGNLAPINFFILVGT